MPGPRRPHGYSSLEEFEREEIRSNIKIGWSLDEIYQDARQMNRRDRDEEEGPQELNFDY
jgi:hypothetical protein